MCVCVCTPTRLSAIILFIFSFAPFILSLYKFILPQQISKLQYLLLIFQFFHNQTVNFSTSFKLNPVYLIMLFLSILSLSIFLAVSFAISILPFLFPSCWPSCFPKALPIAIPNFFAFFSSTSSCSSFISKGFIS